MGYRMKFDLNDLDDHFVWEMICKGFSCEEKYNAVFIEQNDCDFDYMYCMT